jgi:hypothetical protein
MDFVFSHYQKLARANILASQVEAIGKEYAALVADLPDQERKWSYSFTQDGAPHPAILSPKYGKLHIMVWSDHDLGCITGKFDLTDSFKKWGTQKPREQNGVSWMQLAVNCDGFFLKLRARLPLGQKEFPVPDQEYLIVAWLASNAEVLRANGLLPMDLRSSIRPFEADIFSYVAGRLRENQNEHKRNLDAYIASLKSYTGGERAPKKIRLE